MWKFSILTRLFRTKTANFSRFSAQCHRQSDLWFSYVVKSQHAVEDNRYILRGTYPLWYFKGCPRTVAEYSTDIKMADLNCFYTEIYTITI